MSNNSTNGKPDRTAVEMDVLRGMYADPSLADHMTHLGITEDSFASDMLAKLFEQMLAIWTANIPEAMRRQLLDVALKATHEDALGLLKETRHSTPVDESLAVLRRLNRSVGAQVAEYRFADQIERKEVRWLWQDRFPLGRISIISGVPGVGKSFLTAELAAKITNGEPWPTGDHCPDGNVVMICAEDNAEDTIKPRLEDSGADLKRVVLIDGVKTKKKGSPRLLSFLDVEAIMDVIHEVGDVRLLIMDPIGSFLGGKVDGNQDNQIRSNVGPLAKEVEKTDTSLILVGHQKKGHKGSADEGLMGSRGWSGIARCMWHLGLHPENEALRLMAPGKTNLGPKSTTLGFTIEGDPVAVHWQGHQDMTADEMVDPDVRRKRRGNQARQFLQDLLSDGPKTAKEVQAAAEEAGIPWITIKRQSKDLVTKAKDKGSPHGGWTWTLQGDHYPDSES